jgi:hypothetical protein
MRRDEYCDMILLLAIVIVKSKKWRKDRVVKGDAGGR